MAGSLRSSSMRGGRTRRSMSEINVVPYIDVMLVLLVIFMVTAPLVPPGAIDLPSVKKVSAPKNVPPIEIVIKKDGSIELHSHDARHPIDRAVAPAEVARLVKGLQDGADPAQPPAVIISADKTVQYDNVLQVMDSLRKVNIQRVGLAVKAAP